MCAQMGDILVMRSPNVCSRAVLELHTSPGMHALGLPKWQLVLCVLLVFIILYLALFKGVNSSGKVVWVTATAPYVILTLLLLRGVLLPGAGTGVKYYLQPNVTKLLETQVTVRSHVLRLRTEDSDVETNGTSSFPFCFGGEEGTGAC